MEPESLAGVLNDGVAANWYMNMTITKGRGSYRLSVSDAAEDQLVSAEVRADGLVQVVTKYGGVLVDASDVIYVSWTTADHPGYQRGMDPGGYA